MKNNIILLLVVTLTLSNVLAEYGQVTENFTFTAVTYPKEHLKGGTYTITFITPYAIESNTFSSDISMGTNYENTSHRFFEYKIYEGIIGGYKTFSWNVIDEDEDIIEVVYIDIHVLLDSVDEGFLQSQLDAKDNQITQLKEDLDIAEQQNRTIIYEDRTFTQMIGDNFQASSNAVILLLFIGSLVSIPPTIQGMKAHRMKKSLDHIKNSVRMKTNFWEITFDVLDKLAVFHKEGYKVDELEIDKVFQKEWIVFASMFSPYPADWLTCMDEDIKKDERFKDVDFYDKSVGERIERIRAWDRLNPVSERYDLWAQFIRFALIPCCVLFPEFWENQIDPLTEKYKEYSEKAKEENEKAKTTSTKNKSDKPAIISQVSSAMRGDKYPI